MPITTKTKTMVAETLSNIMILAVLACIIIFASFIVNNTTTTHEEKFDVEHTTTCIKNKEYLVIKTGDNTSVIPQNKACE